MITIEQALAFLSPQERALLASMTEERTLAPGENCFVEGNRDEYMAFVLAGLLAVKKPTEFPGKSLVIALLGPGAPVGEGGLLLGGPHGATVSAVEEVRLAVLPRPRFEELRRNAPDLTIKLLTHLLGIVNLRLQSTSHRLSLVL